MNYVNVIISINCSCWVEKYLVNYILIFHFLHCNKNDDLSQQNSLAFPKSEIHFGKLNKSYYKKEFYSNICNMQYT